MILSVSFKTPSPASFPEFLLTKILGESMDINILWVALEFSLQKIQAMTTMQFMRFETDSQAGHIFVQSSSAFKNRLSTC